MEWNLIILIISVVILFLFSIRKFSEEVQKVSGKRFKDFLKKLTRTPLRGTFIGAFVTSIVQSSSATTVILVGLVSAGLISFRNSLGVIFGANIGTTITSQLIALNLTSIAPFFIILGFLIELFGRKFKLLGRPIFYFGLVFFSLSLISTYMEPLASNPYFISFLSSTSNILIAIFLGFLFTFFVQSSSITSGLAVVLVGGGLLNFTQAIGIIFGANIGTTTTAIFSSWGLNKEAKKTALAHFLFNILGVLMFLPFLFQFENLVTALGGSAQQQVANAHLIFNLVSAGIFLIFISPFEKLVEKLSDKFSNLIKKIF